VTYRFAFRNAMGDIYTAVVDDEGLDKNIKVCERRGWPYVYMVKG